jgi:hypothetical protein
MKALHLDSSAIDRVGVPTVRAHFGISRQVIFYWRRQGVPNEHRKELALLGRKLGHEMPEMKIKRERKRGRPPTSGSQPTSPATPA